MLIKPAIISLGITRIRTLKHLQQICFIFLSQINCTARHQTIIKTNFAGTDVTVSVQKSMTDPQRWAVQLTRDSASDDTGHGTAHQCRRQLSGKGNGYQRRTWDTRNGRRNGIKQHLHSGLPGFLLSLRDIEDIVRA
jgi:hypothetical protein